MTPISGVPGLLGSLTSGLDHGAGCDATRAMGASEDKSADRPGAVPAALSTALRPSRTMADVAAPALLPSPARTAAGAPASAPTALGLPGGVTAHRDLVANCVEDR